MSLKISIENIFEENRNYKNPSQAVNQASSLNALSGDLYTDSRRFIYELLQNADDSAQNNNSVQVWIKIFDDYLVVAHSGRGFDSRDLRGICNVNNGTKKLDTTKTGYKGIGFKSVFGQSENVTIYTNNEYFRFDSSFNFGWDWNGSKEEWEQNNDREFQYPWQIIPIYTESNEILESVNQYLLEIDAKVATIIRLNNLKETSQAVQNLSQNLNMFLFLKNITTIHFNVSNPTSIEIDRTVENRITLKQNEELKATWLNNTISLNVPKELKASLQDERNIPDKLLNTDTIELSLAAKVGSDGIIKLSAQERLLYAYLPTDETRYSLPVLVNTSFLTTANRESLHADSKWNQWIFKNISIETFKWVAKLVKTEFQYQAYRLIPEKTRTDELGNKFNEGIDEALRNIPFILARDNDLVKVEETIVDFTFLSTKEFVGEVPIKSFVEKEVRNCKAKKFTKNTDYGSTFKKLGANCFEWKDITSFLRYEDYISRLSIDKNIKLIKHFKFLCGNDKVKDVTIDTLQKLTFIRDHKNILNYPTQICFPNPEDQNWNNPQNELSFLHLDLQNWLLEEGEIRLWLESLGMTEKTDITYITQTIIPKVGEYITKINAKQTIQDLFLLYQKGDLKDDLLNQLSELKLLTTNENLCPANECFFSDYYYPRLKIEEVSENDIFVSETYCNSNLEKDEWKRFFKIMGVNEGVTPVTYERQAKDLLVNVHKLDESYFNEEDKKFNPFISTFTADEYLNLTSLSFLLDTDNFNFANLFWNDVIENVDIEEFNGLATAFWGNSGHPGRNSGDKVANYLRWYVRNKKCIPTLMEECYDAKEIFINTDNNVELAGKYLPVFSEGELSQDWRAFFDFRTTLQLEDYLEILSKVSSDVNDEGKIKRENVSRVQAIYSILLDQCINWSSDDIAFTNNWAEVESLLNTKKEFSECQDLKFFLEGNESIFQDQFYFLDLNAENKNHPNIEVLLKCFNVKILKQSDFKLDHSRVDECSSLMLHLKTIIPYFRIWIENEVNDDKTKESFAKLQSRISKLNIYQAEQLSIKYEDIDFTKSVNVHFNDSVLYVTNPWDKNSVLLKLPEVLCRYFYLLGHDKKLDFLLRSTIEEIRDYFIQENITIQDSILETVPEILQEQHNDSLLEFNTAIDEGNILLEEFFHTSKTNYNSLQYAEKIIIRATFNILKYLEGIPEYDCTHASKIANSIIGGITKNGNEITIVARPSDGGEVLPYYASEFDVLEYVDAEFWCEDGINTPKQITLGQLLKKTGINRIPINNIDISNSDLEILVDNKKSETLDYSAVPFVPEKVARIISSFANTNGGTLIFGLKEISPNSNEIVGLSRDFNIVEIIKKAVSLLSPIPIITYDWVNYSDKAIFVINTEKGSQDILFENKKYIRNEAKCELFEDSNDQQPTLNIANYNKTIAIIIAIEEYKQRDENQVSRVKYAKADALKFENALIENMNIEKSDIHTFIDGDALKSDLEYELSRLFHFLTEKDRLIFYYVGHGFHNGIENYLSTFDMHPYNISSTAVSLRKILLDPLQKCKCKNALIFIDACAQSFQNENERSQITDINDEEFLLLKNEFPYYATFLSCLPTQSSYSSDVLKNGIWTHHLVKALRGEVLDILKNNKYLTDTLLKEYLSVNVAEYTKNELGYNQNPKAILDSSNENVILEVTEVELSN